MIPRRALAGSVGSLVILLGCSTGASEADDHAVGLALAHADVQADEVQIEVREVGPGEVEVLLVRDVSAQDDSVRAVRHVVTVTVQGTRQVIGSRVEQACQPGRGHHDFASDPCL